VFADCARELGRTLAERRIELVYGGAHVGLMGVLADAVLASGGHVTGVLPRFMADKELAHPRLTRLELVATMHERKQRMVELAEGFVALPGGLGTFEEIFEAVTWQQLHLHAHPCALLNVNGFYDPLREFLAGATRHGFIRQEQHAQFIVVNSVNELFERFAHFHPVRTEKWLTRQRI
jgi:uncharacterized protein (TIGR00730 family)